MKRLVHLITTIAAGLRSFDDLVDENDRLAASNETLRARIIEQQAEIDRLRDLKEPIRIPFETANTAPKARIGWGNR